MDNKEQAVREDKSDKIMYHLIPTDMIRRLAKHYTGGAKKYGDRNRELGDLNFAEKCKESAWRHFVSWQEGQMDEDHAMAVVFNIFAYETLKKKDMENRIKKAIGIVYNKST